MASEELGPLPAGRHGYSREQVEHNQRERLIAGLATAVAEHGYAAVTITHITKAARVSRRVFYANFESKEECFLVAFEVVAGYVRELAAAAAAEEDDWAHRAIAAARAALSFFAEEPDLARLCLVESTSAGSAVASRFRAAIDEVEPFLAQGREERTSAERDLPVSTEASILGALVSLASRRVGAGEAARLPELLPDFAEFILAPYLGAAEAARLAREAA
ncbi:MAG: TetR/AcrR family transcriptional regulator [Solirubrobacterales bacterium]